MRAGADSAMSPIRQLWRGEFTLVLAFWVCGVIGVVAPYLVFSTLLIDEADPGVLPLLAYLLLSLTVQTLVSVGIWRSAGRYRGPRLYALAARTAVVLYAVFGAYQIVTILLMFTLLVTVLLDPPFIR